jgi:hypothetical protein
LSQLRSTARRHKGARKIRVERDEPAPVRSSHPATNPRDAIRFWRDYLAHVTTPVFVYFIQDARGPVKIGRAGDPLGRMSELQCGNPYDLTLRAVVLAYTEDVEQRIHDMWQTAHVRGEWFGAGSESDILARARQAQREQVEAVLSGDPEGYGHALDVPLLVLSQTGMQRG